MRYLWLLAYPLAALLLATNYLFPYRGHQMNPLLAGMDVITGPRPSAVRLFAIVVLAIGNCMFFRDKQNSPGGRASEILIYSFGSVVLTIMIELVACTLVCRYD